MRIEIDDCNAVIITFHTRSERFVSDYERTKFFRELHGWKQSVPCREKRYVYRRGGLLDEVPHIKIADSVFAVSLRRMQEVMEFFDEWGDKVDCETMRIKVIEDRLLKMLEEL